MAMKLTAKVPTKGRPRSALSGKYDRRKWIKSCQTLVTFSSPSLCHILWLSGQASLVSDEQCELSHQLKRNIVTAASQIHTGHHLTDTENEISPLSPTKNYRLHIKLVCLLYFKPKPKVIRNFPFQLMTLLI